MRNLSSHPKKIHGSPGFALVITVSLMVLLALLAVGLLSLGTVALRSSRAANARATAMANARMGLVLALGELQKKLGDDRRITADASILAAPNSTEGQDEPNAFAVGVWDGWSPRLRLNTGRGVVPTPNYTLPKSQAGFHGWLVSATDPESVRQLNWHSTGFQGGDTPAHLFTPDTSGFALDAQRVAVGTPGNQGAFAWAVIQENTKARLNIGTDERLRIEKADQLQAPSRPNLANSTYVKDPGNSGGTESWAKRRVAVSSLSQAALDTSYDLKSQGLAQASRDYTTYANSLLTNPVDGGVKADMSAAFEMPDGEFQQMEWSDRQNPFRSDVIKQYAGEKELFQPVSNTADIRVRMDFPPISPNLSYHVNGAATMDLLRNFYRSYRYLYQSSGEATAYERPYSHISIANSFRTPSLPYGRRTQPNITPVLDRMYLLISLVAETDGSFGYLFTPVVTMWNPHNTAMDVEGIVVYPTIDFALFTNVQVRSARTGATLSGGGALSRYVSDGWANEGRSTKPYFYFHITPDGNGRVGKPIHFEPGEVRVFCLSSDERRDLLPRGSVQQRTWFMKPVGNVSDLITGTKGGVILNFSKAPGGTTDSAWLKDTNGSPYKLQRGDTIMSQSIRFEKGSYQHILNVADSWQIKNPGAELMMDARSANSGLPALKAEPNLMLYSQIHTGPPFEGGSDSISYPSLRVEQIQDNPQIVGVIAISHLPAETSRMGVADLMFTVNPRQPIATRYLSPGARFASAPNYDIRMIQGTTLAALGMETTVDGRQAFYGASNSRNTGRTHLPVFELPRSPTLSLGAFQHCDLTSTVFGNPSQIGNSWVSPYVDTTTVVKRLTSSPSNDQISPALGVYDVSYLANEALFDDYFLSSLAPEVSGISSNGNPSAALWEGSGLRSETKSMDTILQEFFEDPSGHPLRNPRMIPYTGALSIQEVLSKLSGPAKAARLGAYLMYEGGFNVNSTSKEAWVAMLSSLRGIDPASGDKVPMSRFRNILTGGEAAMGENDPWSGFRTLSDQDIQSLAENLVEQVRRRGPFQSLGEFVNRQISRDSNLNLGGALQSAIDATPSINNRYKYAKFNTSMYPNSAGLRNPNTGTNTPGWLSQADVLTALAPALTVRSDTFIIRSQGEARSENGEVLSTVMLEAVVQRVPEWVDPVDDPSAPVANLSSRANQRFGRRFVVVSVRELINGQENKPV